MQLNEEEEVLKIYHHHLTPFIWKMVKLVVYVSPFYILLFLSSSAVSTRTYIILHIVLITIFVLLAIYMILIYWMDKLIITNQRVIYVDYKFLTVSQESQAFIQDIQDIISREKGVLSYLKMFDYGLLRVETSASNVTIVFENAPDPEGIRQFIFHLRTQ